MKKFLTILFACTLLFSVQGAAQQNAKDDKKEQVAADTPKNDSAQQQTEAAVADTAADVALPDADEEFSDDEIEEGGIHQELKSKFIEGDASYMSLVALVFVIGLALCIERIIYLSLAEVDTKKLMADIEDCVEKGDIEGAKEICRNTRGPVASICYQGLSKIDEEIDTVERSIVSYASVQSTYLEQHCSWITLFIAIAPSLGFLGTVIGMVKAFEAIEVVGDINATTVAGGMRVALITTIFGIIVALVLQIFYNYIISKIESLTSDMEDSAINLLDIIAKQKK